MNMETGYGLEFFGATEAARAVLTRTAHSFAIAAGLPQAAAAAMLPDAPGSRTYLCDEESHTIHVLDEQCRPVFSFGGFGSGLGQFDTPAEAAVIWTSDPSAPAFGAEILVVADRGNHRIQLFETDGAVIGAIGGTDAPDAGDRPSPRAAWPFFRLDDGPSLPLPTRIEWRAPYLEVTCGDDQVVRVDLAVALLPDFATWLECASPLELRQAFDRFMTGSTGVPDWCLYEIAERLQPVAGERLAS